MRGRGRLLAHRHDRSGHGNRRRCWYRLRPHSADLDRAVLEQDERGRGSPRREELGGGWGLGRRCGRIDVGLDGAQLH